MALNRSLSRTRGPIRVFCVVALVGHLVACDRPAIPEPPERLAAPDLGVVMSAAARPRPGGEALQVRPRPERDAGPRLRREPEASWQLRLRAPAVPAQGLALTEARLGRIVSSGLEVRSLGRLGAAVQIPMEGLQRVVPLIGGSLLAFGMTATYRVSARHDKARRFARTPLVALSTVYPDPGDVTHYWLADSHAGSLSEYFLSDSRATDLPERSVELSDREGRALGRLRDGRFIHATAGELVLTAPRGTSQRRALPSGLPEAAFLLPTARLDRFWWVPDEGEALLMQVGPSVRVIGRYPLPGTVFAAATARNLLALVVVQQPGDRAKSWWLVLYSPAGERWRQRLKSARHSEFQGWLERETANRGVALSPGARWVAVGGRTDLTVWRVRPKQMLFPSEP